MNNLGKEIPMASESTIDALIKLGILYVGDDKQLHVKEIHAQTAKSEQG